LIKKEYVLNRPPVVNVLRPLLWGLFVFVLYVGGAFQYMASFAQVAVIESGLVNASSVGNSKISFDYNFTIKDLSGKKIDFKDHQGKVIFLNLWATWCGPCRSEMASIQKLYDRVDNKKIQFVMLSLDRDSQLEKVKAYMVNHSFSFPVYMPSGYLSDQLQVTSIPTTFVITKDGIIDLKEVGMKNYNTSKFKGYLEELSK
jgi:thiol-disulfide isomerase/thioredoxin